jgi:hypothetical protein
VTGRRALVLAAIACGALAAVVRAGGLGQPGSNVHDLSATGPGAIHAQSAGETQICVFCHTPHNATPAQELWNHEPTPAGYTIYGSTTLNPGTVVLQPSGSARLCLSCHDGTIAIGATRMHGVVAMTGTGGGKMPVGSSNLGGGSATPDLSDDHPVSFVPVPTAEIVNPPAGDPVRLDASGMVQCTSCHDPHNDARDPNPGGLLKFLVKSNRTAAICQTCHHKQFWSSVPGIHSTSTATWNSLGTNPFHTGYVTVADNACESCHRAHAAPGAMRLLNGQDPSNAARRGEEWSCQPCHNGNVAAKNVVSEFSKPYVHPTFSVTPSAHDPTESPSNATFRMPETNPAAPRHAECFDCHNPHAARNAPAVAPAAPGDIQQTWGISSIGSYVAAIGNEYELCFKCHSSSANKPQPAGQPWGPYTSRAIPQFDARLEFQTSNPSYHPVLGPRNNTEVPSLRPPYATSSVIYCTECHNNDTGTNVGGTGPRGPHGSNFKRLLERRLDLTDGTAESATIYALCYKCHDRDNILGDNSFGEHRRHIGNVRASCMTCHDPHGVSAANGATVLNNSHLINFNLAEVTAVPGVSNTPRYEDTGLFHGRCYLDCHGHEHNPSTY